MTVLAFVLCLVTFEIGLLAGAFLMVARFSLFGWREITNAELLIVISTAWRALRRCL